MNKWYCGNELNKFHGKSILSKIEFAMLKVRQIYWTSQFHDVYKFENISISNQSKTIILTQLSKINKKYVLFVFKKRSSSSISDPHSKLEFSAPVIP